MGQMNKFPIDFCPAILTQSICSIIAHKLRSAVIQWHNVACWQSTSLLVPSPSSKFDNLDDFRRYACVSRSKQPVFFFCRTRFLKIHLFVLLSFLLWASSDRYQTSSTSIVSYAFYSLLNNWLWVKKSVKTVKFRS